MKAAEDSSPEEVDAAAESFGVVLVTLCLVFEPDAELDLEFTTFFQLDFIDFNTFDLSYNKSKIKCSETG